MFSIACICCRDQGRADLLALYWGLSYGTSQDLWSRASQVEPVLNGHGSFSLLLLQPISCGLEGGLGLVNLAVTCQLRCLTRLC